MTRVRLIWVWLAALMILVAGCGDDDNPPPPPPRDAATDALDARRDAPDAQSDVRADVRPDVTPDMGTPDRGPDVTPDRAPDVTPDRAPDVTPDRAPDVTPPLPDVMPPLPDVMPPPPDAPDVFRCTADSQCPASTPRCNTTTGACVARVSISVTPPNPTIANGTSRQFTATMTYSDNSTSDVTTQATWSSSAPNFATVGANTGLAQSVAPGETTITATVGTVSGSTLLTVTAATLQSIAVTHPNTTSPRGTTEQFTATGTYSDSTTQDLTTQVTWTSATAAVATINAAGLATAIDVGTSVITAAFQGQSGTATMTVTAATLQSLSVTPATPTMARQTTLPFTATGTFTDNTTQDLTTSVTWASSNVAAATISNTDGSRGLATGVGAGATTISATSGGVTGQTVLTVTGATLTAINISPANPTIADGLVQQFIATGQYDDNTTQNLTTLVTWSSSDTAVAVVSNTPGSQGLATSVNPGQTTITAVLGGTSATTTLTVTNATLLSIAVSPLTPRIARGTTQQFTAIGTYTDNTTQDITAQVTWGSTDTNVAPISNVTGSNGRATGQNVGTVTISAALAGRTASTTLEVTAATLSSIGVTPTNPTIAKGNSRQFVATGTYSDGSTQNLTATATWSTTDNAIATISNAAADRGLAAGVNPGTVNIVAAVGAISGATQLTVTPAVLVSIEVTPAASSTAKGTTVQFTATGTYTDNTSQDLTALVSWSSSNGGQVTISNATLTKGLATANNVGTPTITANYLGVSGSTTLNVTAATLQSIAITPVNPTIPRGASLQFTATGTYSDSSTQNITTQVSWSSGTPTVATVDDVTNKGLVTGVAQGEAVITASSGAISATRTVIITAPTLNSVTVSPAGPTALPVGLTQQFEATAHYSDGSTSTVTADANWSSSASNFATISNAAGSQGLATGVAAGSTVITAVFDGVSGAATLNVTAAVLQSITVAPPSTSIAKGTTVQFTATGNYSDGSTEDLTATATWGPTTNATATVSNAAGSKGRATGHAAGGPVTVTATHNTIVGSAQLTVTAATLSSIAITPATPSIARGTTQQFVATGTYSDTTTQILTTQVTWGSSNGSVATISNTAGSNGLATGVAAGGPVTISASLDGVTASTTLTVTSATLTSISVTPANGATTPGSIVQFTATGSYSDATQQNITNLVTWGSSNTGVATISNLAGSQGHATAVAAGTTTISALMPGTTPITGTTGLTVNP